MLVSRRIPLQITRKIVLEPAVQHPESKTHNARRLLRLSQQRPIAAFVPNLGFLIQTRLSFWDGMLHL
jgi:hypothetical protein